MLHYDRCIVVPKKVPIQKRLKRKKKKPRGAWRHAPTLNPVCLPCLPISKGILQAVSVSFHINKLGLDGFFSYAQVLTLISYHAVMLSGSIALVSGPLM